MHLLSAFGIYRAERKNDGDEDDAVPRGGGRHSAVTTNTETDDDLLKTRAILG